MNVVLGQALIASMVIFSEAAWLMGADTTIMITLRLKIIIAADNIFRYMTASFLVKIH
jgi:hypothetical protein